jgi:maleate isomerase
VTAPAGLRIGVIVPSSNTALEAEIAARKFSPVEVTFHFSRVGVTTITLERAASSQFDHAEMMAAAMLLADTEPDVLTWAGTSGSWLGVDRDRVLARAMTEQAGIPSTTTTLALLDACRDAGTVRVALVTPYIDSVVRRIIDNFADEGIEVVAERHLGITDNHAFGLVTPEQISRLANDCPLSGVEAMMVICTNLRASGLVSSLRQRLGIPVLDSIDVTLRQALTMADAEHLKLKLH